MTASGRSPVSGLSLRRRSLLLGGLGGAAALATLGHGTTAVAQPPQLPEFDFDTDNTLDFMFPPDERSRESASADFFAPMDVTLYLWFTQSTAIAWFDAVAPYHPTAVGVHTRVGRRPSSESATNRNMNIALFHASYQVLKVALPDQAAVFGQLLTLLGLDPDDESEDPTSPVGIGNLAGKGAATARLRDGMNLLGDEGRRYHLRPFADYTGYQPVNTAYELVNPSRWQPQLTPHRRRLGAGAGDKGIYTVQQFVTPQMALAGPYTFTHPGQFRLPPPEFSDHRRRKAYRRSVDEVLEASAALTDGQKVTAEFFDNKLVGIGQPPAATARLHPELDVPGWTQLILAHSTATYDAMIAVWHQKVKYDAVRPVSAIRHVYGSRPVTGWGGVGVGTVDDIPADEWTSYLKVGDHPEYPSGSAVACSSGAQAVRRFFDDDALEWRLTIPVGWTQVEAGITPAEEVELYFPTWTEYEQACADSRLWGGVHFRQTQERSVPFGHQFGDLAYEFTRRHVDGDVEH